MGEKNFSVYSVLGAMHGVAQSRKQKSTIEEATDNSLRVEYYAKMRWRGIGEELKMLSEKMHLNFRAEHLDGDTEDDEYIIWGSDRPLWVGFIDGVDGVQVMFSFQEHAFQKHAWIITSVDEVDKIPEITWNWLMRGLYPDSTH